MAQPYVFARIGAPDLEFGRLDALAAAIDSARLLAAGETRVRAIRAVLARDPLPGGHVVAVRVCDGAHAGKGAILGYAFMPGHPIEDAAVTLIEAIERGASRREALAA